MPPPTTSQNLFTKIHHYPPPPTTSQNISTTTHHQPKYIHHHPKNAPPPSKSQFNIILDIILTLSFSSKYNIPFRDGDFVP